MRILKVFLFLFFCLLLSQAYSQTDTTGLNRDSAAASPTARTRAIVKKDTTVGPSVKSDKKSKVVKDSARLALEALPGKAAWSSAIVPGLGQIKNHRWWKVPFVYGGLVSIALAFEFNNRYYKEVLAELQYRTEPARFPKPPNSNDYVNVGNDGLISARDYYRRNRDLSVLGFVAVHAINIIDAYVDAKFFRYDISDKLGVTVRPTLLQDRGMLASHYPVPGLSLRFGL